MARRVMMLLAIASLGVLALAFAGCGSSKSAATTETTAATTTETTTEATTEATDTTATDTTATDTTATETTDTTSTSGTGSFADAGNCKEFAEFGQKISSAFTGTGDADLQKVADELDQMAAAAPSDIKPDFQTIAGGYRQIADALNGVDLTSGKTPDAATIAKLSRLSTQLGTKMSTASQNIATWAQQNCTG